MGRSWVESGTERAGVIAGRYTLVSEVGRGGMGVVWRGVDEVLDREVALKRVGMSPGGVSPDLARSEREARLLASMNHPNVVAVFDLVNDGDEQWLVMEYVENRTLAQLVRERGTLSPDDAAGLLVQAASALAAAHRAGIVHRDVKPSNILVTPHGQVKLSDFGIARAHTDATLTQTGLMSGSPAYLSPEVASGSSASAASDVWALGATLYHALTGRPPFDVGDNVMGALYQIVHADPPRPDNAGWLLPLLEHTMTKDPADRWSMTEVRDFLAKGGGTTVAAAPAPDRQESIALLAPVNPPASEAPTTAAASSTPTASSAPTAAAAGVGAAAGAGAGAGAAAASDSPGGSSGDDSGRSRPARPTGGSSRRLPGWLLPVLLVGAVVLLLGLGFWALSPGDGERPGTAADEPDQSTSPSATEGEETPSESPSASPEATAEGMETFVGDYLSTVTTDPDTSWTWLTPEFQQASGGIDDYKGFWSTIQTAELESVDADPEAMTVDYTVTYTKTNGDVTTEDVSLGLVLEGDQYLIASES